MGPPEDQGPLRIGDEYLAKYQVLSVLGHGGFGWVYRAFDKYLGREAAIKVIPRDPGRTASLRARAQQEAQLLWKLRHPNIVEVWEAGVDSKDHSYIVMEFLKGHTLQTILERHRRLSIGEMLQWLLPITHALDEAHRLNAVHRDLKPPNIIVTFDNIVKVIDFGIAKIPGREHTARNRVLGSSGFLSPEQLDGKLASPRSDIYALGVMMFLLLYGRHPLLLDDVDCLSDQEIARRTRFEIPPFLHDLVPGFPEDLSRLIWSQLAKLPGQRCESAGHLRTRLLRCAERITQQAPKELEIRTGLLDFDPEAPPPPIESPPARREPPKAFVTKQDELLERIRSERPRPPMPPPSGEATALLDPTRTSPTRHEPLPAREVEFGSRYAVREIPIRPLERSVPGASSPRKQGLLDTIPISSLERLSAAEVSRSPVMRRRSGAPRTSLLARYLQQPQVQVALLLIMTTGTLLGGAVWVTGMDRPVTGEAAAVAREVHPTVPAEPPRPDSKPPASPPVSEVTVVPDAPEEEPPPPPPASAPVRRPVVSANPVDPLSMEATMRAIEEELRQAEEDRRKRKAPNASPRFAPRGE